MTDPVKTVDVQGQSLEYRWAGEAGASRPTIVMLHEGLGSISMWKTFPDLLAARTGCRVLVYSRAGYGGSSPASLPRQPNYMHDEAELILPALLRTLGIERPILFGHSDGGSIALIFAARYPGNVRGLILEAPHVFVEQLTVDSIAKAKVAYQSTDLKSKLGRYHTDADRAFWGWNDIWLDPRFLAWNIEAHLPAIRCPILLIQGFDDEYGTTVHLDLIAEATPDTKIVLLETCGHSPHRDQVEDTLLASEAFVESVQRTTVA